MDGRLPVVETGRDGRALRYERMFTRDDLLVLNRVFGLSPVVELHLGRLPFLKAPRDVGGSSQDVFDIQEELLSHGGGATAAG